MKLPEELEEHIARTVSDECKDTPCFNAVLDAALRAAEIALEWASEMVCDRCGETRQRKGWDCAWCGDGLDSPISRAQYLAEREREER